MWVFSLVMRKTYKRAREITNKWDREAKSRREFDGMLREDGLEKGPATYGYLAMEPLIEVLRNSLDPDEEEAMDILEDLVESIEIQAWVDPDHTTYELLISPPEKDFGPGIEALAEAVADRLRNEHR